MKVGDLNALDVGFWWVQRADSTELTIIKVTTDFDEDEDGFGVIMGSDRYQKIDDYRRMPLPEKCPTPREIIVRKTIFGTTPLAASLMQTAVAAEHHHRSTRADRAPRNGNNQVAAPSPAELNIEYWRGSGGSRQGAIGFALLRQ
jgi:hypothetical protein